MNIYKYIISILISSIIIANSLTVEEILEKSLHRVDDINYRFKLSTTNISKKDKVKYYHVLINWPANSDVLNQVKISRINAKIKNPVNYWIQNFRDGSDSKTFMSLPITGKVKDISNKKSNNKEFSFTELWISEDEINISDNKLLKSEKINNLLAYVIDSKIIGKNGKIKKHKRIWIDVETYMVLKTDLYTKSGRLYKSINCSELVLVEGIIFPKMIKVDDLKTKDEIQIKINEIEINPRFELHTFIPMDQ